MNTVMANKANETASGADRMESNAAPLLTLNGLAKSFGGLKVLQNITLSIPSKQITGLIGPNGSGKTTLFNIISGFIAPNHGRVEFDGTDITGMTVQQRCRQGLVRTFQTPKVFESLTTIENVMAGFHRTRRAGVVESMIGTRRSRGEIADARELGMALLETFDLADHASLSASRLSAGQRRSLEIARALAASPKFLMLDEPSTGLTRDETAALAARLQRLRDEGVTVLVVSHDMDFIRVTQRTHVLYFGEIIASGDLATIQANPTVRQVYLGS